MIIVILFIIILFEKKEDKMSSVDNIRDSPGHLPYPPNQTISSH